MSWGSCRGLLNMYSFDVPPDMKKPVAKRLNPKFNVLLNPEV